MSADFDGVARAYACLEYLAFGGALQRARVVYFPALRACRRILVIGDGDGRGVAALAPLAPAASIHCIDTSAAMLQLAARRIAAHDRTRVTFERADVRTLTPAPESWDAVLTMFVLDCLSPAEVRAVAARLSDGLCPGGNWLFADFAIPKRGWRHVRARCWVALLYAFFRWQTGIEATTLPPMERILEETGLVAAETTEFQAGMVRAVRWTRPSRSSGHA